MEERAYNIPLRPVYNRAKRAVRAKRAMKHIREFIARHMKVDEEHVKIHPSVNEVIWQRGIQKPPRKVKVVAVKSGDVVWVYTPEERAKIVQEQKKSRKRATSRKRQAKKEKEGDKKQAKSSGKKETAETEGTTAEAAEQKSDEE